MSPSLPAEVLELVFTCLNDDNDIDALRACSLVSSGFLPVARSLLFSHVFLLPEPRQLAPRSCSLAPHAPPRTEEPIYVGPRSESLSPYVPITRTSPAAQRRPEFEPNSGNACVKLLRLLTMSPSIAYYIKRVSVIDGRLFPIPNPSFQRGDTLFSLLGPNDTQSSRYFQIRDQLNGSQWFLSTPPRILYSLFEHLNIRAFDLVFQDGPKVSWDLIPRDVRRALNYLFTSPSLSALELRRVSWDTPASLREFTGTLSQGSIRNLTLRNVKLLSTAFGSERERSLRQNYDQLPSPRPQSHQHRPYRSRGRSPTPRSDSPPIHTPQAQAHPLNHQQNPFEPRDYVQPYPSPVPHAKPNHTPRNSSQNQNQTLLHAHARMMSTSSSPFTIHQQHLHVHCYENVDAESDTALRLDSLGITGSSFSDLAPPQDPDSSRATLDLLRVLLLSPSSETLPCQMSDVDLGHGLEAHNRGQQAPGRSSYGFCASTNYSSKPDCGSSGESKGSLVDPNTLKRLSIPDVEFNHLPELIDILSRSCSVLRGSRLEELALGDRLLGLGPTLLRPTTSSTRPQNNNLVIDFSSFQNLQSLKFGAYILPTSVQQPPQTHVSRAVLLESLSLSSLAVSPSAQTTSSERPSQLAQVLQTLPQSLETLSVELAIDKSSITIHDNIYTGSTQFVEDEIREIADLLRSTQGRRPRTRIKVSTRFISSSCPSGFSTMSSAFGSGLNGGNCGLRGRGRGRANGRVFSSSTRNGNDCGVQGGVVLGSKSSTDRDGISDMKTWAENVFYGLNFEVFQCP